MLAHREPLALVLLDLVLPERSGLSVLAELSGPRHARVPIIVSRSQRHTLRDAVIQADVVIANHLRLTRLLAESSAASRRGW